MENCRLSFVAMAVIGVLSFQASAQGEALVPVPQEVDLGLSVNWSSCNIGADADDPYGWYLAWGETFESPVYNHDNCRTYFKDAEWLEENDYIRWNHRYAGDMTGVLTTRYDAAQYLLGDGWRMPSVKEWQELYRNTTKRRVVVNDVYGWQLTSTVPGYTDKSIFIPAAGYKGARLEDEGMGAPVDQVIDRGTWAYFWTRDYFPTDDVTGRAWSINDENFDNAGWYDDDRLFGFSIRAVKDKSIRK